jgi:ribonuclease G
VLRWFRRKRTEQEAPAEAAPQVQLEEETAGSSGDVAPPADAEPKPRRRRGTRGGRGRKKKTEETVTAGGAVTPGGAEPAVAAERPKSRRAPSPASDKEESAKPRRRRAPTRKSSSAEARGALADVKKEILVSVDVGEQRVAVLEDGRPSEVYLERRGRRSIAGNVYKGVVDNVLPGMEASFVDIGLERNGFLYVDEIVVPELEGKRHGRRIQDLIERGQEVLVQAVKDPMGTKGARLTTEISLPGRFLVYVPFGEGIGVSRRLEDAERERLKTISKELELPEGGIIIRTAAEGATHEEIAGDLALLAKLWSTIKGRAGRAETPSLVYREAELPLRIVRDLFIRDFERVVVDHERTHRRIVGYLKRTSRDLAGRVELYPGKEPLMQRAGVDQAVRSTLDRRVDLPSGGYLIFDYAEAFTVVDVNTGRFVGGRGKSSSSRLEDTITKNNLEAVQEVVRQLRLRDIGGIIVIDFIDMANPKNRELVENALRTELARDRTKTYVVEISPLGLVEMTRQNVTDGPREILTVPCPTCDGNGIVISAETQAIDAERRLRALAASSRSQAFRVELNSRVAGILIGPGASRLDELERETGRRFFFETSDELPADHFAVLAKGPVSRIEAKSLPVASGQELEVRLEAPHLHGEGDAIARLDGYVITVAGARDKVGETVKIRVERSTRTVAYAVLADGADPEPPVEAGIELEAPVDGEDEEEEGSVSAPIPEPAPDAVADEAKPKKRTRRGSRGGRGRKKQPQGADGAPVAVDEPAGTPNPELASSDGPAVTPNPELALSDEPAVTPNPELARSDEPAEAGEGESEATAAADEQPRKRTRRGSRGGRNRKRRRPAEAAEAGAVPAVGSEAETGPSAGLEDETAAVAAAEEAG